MTIKIKAGRVVAISLFALLFFLTSAMFALVICPPNSIERDIEIECKWKGAPVSANLKWTEPKEDSTKTTITNTDSGSKAKSGTTQTSVINKQQALMLTGASAGAALAGGGLLVKKKLEGSSSSEQETKQTTYTSSTSSTAPKYTSDSMRSSSGGIESQQNMKSSQDQSTAQTQKSSIQSSPKDTGVTPIASTLTASVATITKDLLMQKQMDSLTEKSASSTTTQADGTQQSKQVASSTSQNLGLLASSPSSAAQIAAEMWPQKQKELEKLAKQRADIAAKFSIPSYSTGLSLASSFTSATGNTWAKLQGFGSTLGDVLAKAGAAIKPYSKYIVPIVTAAIVVASIFLIPPAAPAFAGAGMGISISQGASLLGAGIVTGGIMLYATHNIIMNYPQQQSFGAEHTQIIDHSTSEIKDEKGSGAYGEDVAQEQLEQAEIRKDRLIQPESEEHIEAKDDAELWLQDDMEEKEVYREIKRSVYDSLKKRYFEVQPDLTSKRYIVECKTGREIDFKRIRNQAYEYILLAKQEGKALVYWLYRKPLPGDEEYWDILRQLYNAGVVVLKGPFGKNIFGGG